MSRLSRVPRNTEARTLGYGVATAKRFVNNLFKRSARREGQGTPELAAFFSLSSQIFVKSRMSSETRL